MAKTATKATKTNKNSKLKLANISGRKKVMFVTLVAFVAIGAGIIIKSFAATTDSVYTVANGNMKPTDYELPATIYNDTSGKSPQQVLRMTSKANGVSRVPATAQFAPYLAGILPNTAYRTCVTVKGGDMYVDNTTSFTHGGIGIKSEGGFYNGRPEDGTGAGANWIGSNNATAIADIGNGYHQYCGKFDTFTYTVHGPWVAYYRGSSPIDVSAFTIQTNVSAPSPAPTK